MAAGFVIRAAEWAGQSHGDFNILSADYANQLGETDAAALVQILTALETAFLAQARSIYEELLPVIAAADPAAAAHLGNLLNEIDTTMRDLGDSARVQRFLHDLFEVETNGELLDCAVELGILLETRRTSA